MPSFATIAGIEIPILTSGAVERAPIYIGDSGRAADGSYGSLVRAKKRNWDLPTGPLLESQYQDIITAIDLDAEVPVTGDFIGGATLTCFVRCDSADYISDGTVDGFFRLAKFVVTEV